MDDVDKVVQAFNIPETTTHIPPDINGRLPTVLYAIKYRAMDNSNTLRTFIFYFTRKEDYDARIDGPEKGQGMKGTVNWEPLTKPVKREKPPIKGQGGLF